MTLPRAASLTGAALSSEWLLADGAADAGVARAEEASEWLRQVEAREASGDWLSADCLFIAIGTVARRARL